MIRGIDISHNNGAVDIAGLPADIAFVSLKASQADAYQDPMFQQFYHDLKNDRPEIVRIPYHFFDPRIGGAAQAQNLLSRGVNFTEPGTGPLMLDVEGDDGGPMDIWTAANLPQAIQNVNDFKTYIWGSAQYGRNDLIIYSFDHYIKGVLQGQTWPDCIFWVASYQATPPPVIPGWAYQFWQYSETGQLDGTTTGGSFDLDQYLGTQDAFNALANNPPA
jgi:GH25 family lysozyme M1 (1,4-beta-N-acetylmuramidase)